jgi:hypothetical protein
LGASRPGSRVEHSPISAAYRAITFAANFAGSTPYCDSPAVGTPTPTALRTLTPKWNFVDTGVAQAIDMLSLALPSKRSSPSRRRR